jgi:hypothetical protein
MEEKYFIYKTTCLIDGKYYIGQHCGDENDGYLGSGISLKKHIEKHGKENFKREILEYAADRIELDELERKYVSPGEVRDRQCLNRTLGGGFILNFGKYSDVFKFLHGDTKKYLSKNILTFRIKKNNLTLKDFYRHSNIEFHKIQSPPCFFKWDMPNIDRFLKFLRTSFHVKNIKRTDDNTISFTIDDVPENRRKNFNLFVKEILHDFNSQNLKIK